MGYFALSLLAAVVIVVFVVRPLTSRAVARRPSSRAHWVAMGAGVVYGVIGRVAFGFRHATWSGGPDWLVQSFAVMSVSFLFLLPLVIGVLDQIAPEPPDVRRRHPWVRAFFSPMLPVLLMVAVMAAITIEGVICIAMALPVLLPLAGVGGCIGLLVRRRTEGRGRALTLSVFLLMPYVASPIEQRLSVPVETRRVENVVEIHAAPEVVWREIKSVRRIDRAELPWRFSHLIGLPRPIEATLSQDGVAGVRRATFERGLTFRETVTRWEPGRVLSFDIHAEPAPTEALDEHVAVGGEYFDVLEGTYFLERTPSGTRLRLESRERLSTRFNFYASKWTDFVMSDLQSAILDVIRKRAEAALRPL